MYEKIIFTAPTELSRREQEIYKNAINNASERIESDRKFVSVFRWLCFVLTIGIFSVLIASTKADAANTAIYADCGLVTCIYTNFDGGTDSDCLIEITMQNGNIFSFFEEGSDYCINDLVSVVLYTNETDTVTDDIILSTKYSGYISDLEAKRWVK